MVGREHLVVVVAGRGDLTRGDDVVAVDETEVELGREPALPLDRVRADVGAREDGGRADLARSLHGLGDDLAATHLERAAKPAERCVEIGERLLEERAPPRRRSRSACRDAVVEHEERQHRLGGLDRGRERRVVVNAEVAGEEDDRDLAQRPAALRP